MKMHRTLNTATIDLAAQEWVGQWYMPTVWSKSVKKRAIGGRDWVLQSFFNATYMDEFEHLMPRFMAELGPTAKKDFLHASDGMFPKRNKADFEELLAKKQAINPAGEHIKGMIGTDWVGQRIAGMHTIEVETQESLVYRRRMKLDKSHRKTYTKVVPNRIDIYAGEFEEHGHTNLANFIRDQSGMALVMNIDAAAAIGGLNFIVDEVDGGAGLAVIAIQSGNQPVDPDAAIAGSQAARLVMAGPAFGGAVDASGKATATAGTIVDSTGETKTVTAGYFVVGSTTTPPTLIDQHISGNVGTTSSFDLNMNTVSFIDGATVSITSYVITMSQGSTAT